MLEFINEAIGLSRIPVVMLTASPSPEHEQRAMELGARSYYRKPDDLDALGEVVRQIMHEWIPATAGSTGSAA